MTDAAEFSRPVRLDQIGAEGRPATIAATPEERAALARRFRVRAIDQLEAEYRLEPVAGGLLATGRLRAAVTQACVATGEDVPEIVDTPFAIRFVHDLGPQAEEVELSEEDCDVVAIEDGRIDMGEAAAQTLALNLTPYPRADGAAAYLRAMGVKREDEAGPLAGLRDLLGKA